MKKLLGRILALLLAALLLTGGAFAADWPQFLGEEAHPGIARALYSGRTEVEPEIQAAFDYVKLGPYIAALGPLNSPTTNQRLYFHGEDITARFWHKGLENNR